MYYLIELKMNSSKGVIIINIIFDSNKNNIKITNGESKVQLNNLKFFVPKTFLSDKIFVIISNSQGKENIIKLSKSSEYNKNFSILKASMDSIITADGGESKLVLFYLEDDTLISTNSVFLDIDYEDYQKGKKIYLLQDFTKDIALTYEKISKMTELNIQLYKDIREVNKE